jgi:hypothetical protein
MSASDPLPSETAPVVDAGKPNSPGAVDPDHIVWTKSVPKKWWRNAHEKASTPLAFSNATGRFSDPTLPFDTLYLGSDAITCFWESGTGRNLTRRFLSDRTISEDDLRSRIEYTVTLDPDSLQIFHADDSRARRSIGALSSACFLADHAVSQLWAAALFGAGAHGILYPSARATDGVCLALFETFSSSARRGTLRALGSFKKVRRSFDNAQLLASLFKERVCLL